MTIKTLFTWPKFILRVLAVLLVLPFWVLWMLYIVSKDVAESVVGGPHTSPAAATLRRITQTIVVAGYFILGGIKSIVPKRKKEGDAEP